MVMELPMQVTSGTSDSESHSCIVQYILFPPHSTSTKDSFSTDEDNDTEVEAVEPDTELNLVTECWVEPQSGTVVRCTDQNRHFQGLQYQEIPQAIFPKDLACMSTMMTFEYLIQLCQNKEWSSSSSPSLQVRYPSSSQLLSPESEEQLHGAPSLPNELLLGLLHSSLEHELSDREVPLGAVDHAAFMQHILSRDFSNEDLVEEDPLLLQRSASSPQWRCYVKYISPQQLLLTFLPASFPVPPDVSAVGGPRLVHGSPKFGQRQLGLVQFLEPPKADLHISFSRQESQQSASDGNSLRCPVYVYNCSLEHLKEQLVHPHASRQPPDVFFRSLSQDRSSLSSWTDLLAPPHKHKELVSFCSLLQEHYHQSYVKGVYRSLQQACSVSSQDVLMAMDYCEESLQEIDITAFLQTLCGHIRLSWEGGKLSGRSHKGPASFVIGEGEEQQASSCSSMELEDTGEQSLVSRTPQSFWKSFVRLFHVLGRQDKFMEILSQHFQSVPSNPHYFFYCPPSPKKEDEEFQQIPVGEVVSEAEPATEDGEGSAPILTESDTDLVVEYEEPPAAASLDGGDERSLSDSNTVNQDQDSFSILDGDSLLDGEGPQLDLPPLFVHVTCSVNMKSCHGSMPIRTLPTCLGEVFSCLENAEALQSVDLNELSVTLDMFVLTLPLEIDVMTDFHHNRSAYTSESSVSLNRSPAQPSSYRSDEELMAALDGLRGIRWLLEDEIVSALRHSRVIDSATLQKVAEHVSRSSGRSHCHCEEVPLQFVFGPEQSLENFKELIFSPELLEEQSSFFSVSSASSRLRPSRVQSVVSSQGSLDSDMRGYDGGSSDSECESPASDDQERRAPLMPDFWLIVKIHQDRVKVYSHARSLEKKEDDQEVPEFLKLHQNVVRRIGEICRYVNQRMLLQDLHDSHVCNSLLVAESEEDIWKTETLCRQSLNTSDDYSTEESYQARDYLAATMHFIPGHFACDVVWSTIIHIHPRLKMGPNMGVARAIQALRSVLNSFCVVNRKNMFVYQERTTKAVFYLRLCETSLAGTVDTNPSRCIGLARSQEPSPAEDLTWKQLKLCSRPVGHVDKHILLLVHGVGNAGPEITDELVKVLRKRLDETTLDIITVMLVRNCKLTPADVEFIQPSGSPATEVMTFSLPQHCLTWLSPVAHYLRQNLLIFLHLPKYTDSNTAHHFKVPEPHLSELADGDIYLYNKPGGQGTGGKGTNFSCFDLITLGPILHLNQNVWSLTDLPASYVEHLCAEYLEAFLLSVWMLFLIYKCRNHLKFMVITEDFKDLCCFLTEPRLFVRFDIWEQGNISPLQLSDKLQGALRHALCDAVMELKVLPNPLCLSVPTAGSRVFKSSPAPITLIPTTGGTPVGGSSTPDSTTPTSKSTRRSFWGILSKPDSGEIGSPKTTDDIVQEKGEEGRAARRRHKTENVKQQWSQEKVVELEQVQRKQASQLEEGDVGFLHPVYQHTCQAWITFMTNLGCPSIQQCTAEMASNFLLPSLLSEIVNLVSSLASDTTVKVFEKISCPPSGDTFVPFPVVQDLSHPPDSLRSFILIGRNFHQWHCSTEQGTAKTLNPAACMCAHELPTTSRPTFLHYNWSVDLGSSLNRELLRLVRWQNARAHVVHCLFNQKMGLFHHYCFSDAPVHDVESKQDPNPFLGPSMEPDALLRSAVPPPSSKEPGRMGGSGRSLAPLHFPSELLPFDEALRDVCTIRPLMEGDVVARHGGQLLEMKAAERREMERQMKIENLFVTWQQRSAQSNMPISATDLEILKHSSRLVHYCATPLLFDPAFRKQIQEEQSCQNWPPNGVRSKRHRSNDSTASGRDRSYSTDSAEMLPNRLKEEPWLMDISNSFLQQYVQYLQSMGFILVQVRPHSPARRSVVPDPISAAAPGTASYHLQRALPGGIVLMELSFQGFYFCVKQYALECSRIPMGQSVNSQLSMLFTEECDKVRDLMHVHSFSYDFHLRVVHQYLVGSHMTLRQGYQLTDFLDDFISHHPDIPKFGRNHVFQGSLSVSTGMITGHQLYNYITDHASTYGMKPLRMSKAAAAADSKKGLPEYALVDLWTSSGSYKDLEGLQHHDDFDVSLVVCHNAAPFEEQSDSERHLLRLRFFIIMTSQRELFPRLTADMRRFKKLPQIYRDPAEPGSRAPQDRAQGLLYSSPLFPLLSNEVASARKQIQVSVEQAMGHCRRDNLWKRLFHGEHAALAKLSFAELEELLEAVHSRSVGEIDPQLDCFLTMSPAWYQSLIKVLLSRFPQNCRHFDNSGVQYLAVLNQKFTDSFVLVFLDNPSGKTSLKVVFREPLPAQTTPSSSPPPQLVSMYHHLESVINTACYNLWTGLL
uniref:SZT2 subunit of KICSTOR complex n=1 Tax=Oryzias melastigma TaxID=30732 RepID=A0A3B3D587_ORYME